MRRDDILAAKATVTTVTTETFGETRLAPMSLGARFRGVAMAKANDLAGLHALVLVECVVDERGLPVFAEGDTPALLAHRPEGERRMADVLRVVEEGLRVSGLSAPEHGDGAPNA